MIIYFVRHAQKKEEGEDSELTDKGIERAKKLGRYFENSKINEFYCSNLKRAKQTAEIVSKNINKKPEIIEGLNEFETDLLKKAKSKWTNKEKERHHSLKLFLDKLTKNKDDDKSVLIIAHGVTNRIIASNILKLPLNRLVPFMQTETGINKVVWNEKHKNWRLIYWNNDSHLVSS